MRYLCGSADDQDMERIRQTVLQLDLTSDRQLVPGTVRASDGKPHPFSGWSELFAVLQRLLPEPGGITETDQGP